MFNSMGLTIPPRLCLIDAVQCFTMPNYILLKFPPPTLINTNRHLVYVAAPGRDSRTIRRATMPSTCMTPGIETSVQPFQVVVRADGLKIIHSSMLVAMGDVLRSGVSTAVTSCSNQRKMGVMCCAGRKHSAITFLKNLKVPSSLP